MTPLEACRMCLSVDARMHVIADTALQHVYEKLTGIPLQSADGKPVTACFVCYHMLKKSHTFIDKSLRADELLQQILDHGLQLTLSTISAIDSSSLRPALQAINTEYNLFIGPPEPLQVCVKEEYIEVKVEGELDVDHAKRDADVTGLCELEQSRRQMEPERQHATTPNELITALDEGHGDLSRNTNLTTSQEEINPLQLNDELKNLIQQQSGNRVENVRIDLQDVQSIVKCKRCGAKFRPELLQDHMKLFHMKADGLSHFPDTVAGAGVPRFQCDRCDGRFYCRQKLKRHIKSHENPCRGRRCDEVLSGSSGVNRQVQLDTRESVSHTRTHTGEKSYRCSQCFKEFSRKTNLVRHIKTHTGEKPHRCNQCNRAFSEKGTLDKHIRIHTGEKPYRCNQCDKAFSQKGTLDAHNIRAHTGAKPYQCSQCDKTFKLKTNLVNHIRTHTGENPYPCNQCNRSFSQKGHLDNHIRIHTGKNPFTCSQCDKTFRHNSDLIMHIRTHTGEKPYRCNHCNRAFSQKGHLDAHIRIHTGEKPYACSRCDKAFRHKSDLVNHIRTHTGEKPYRCNQCDKAFSQKGHLGTHIKIHTGEKPYACGQCDKAFRQKSDLVKHMRTHTGEKPYQCRQCVMAFSRKENLDKHIRIHTS